MDSSEEHSYAVGANLTFPKRIRRFSHKTFWQQNRDFSQSWRVVSS